MFPIRDSIPHRRPPVVNWLLIAANVGVAILQFTQRGALDRFAAVPEAISHGRALYTVFTSMFMHGGFLHILFNMWYLFIFGDNIEDAFGHAGYLLMYLVSGVCGAALQIIVVPSSTIPMVGASGAISGVLGAYMILYPRARILTLLPIIILQFVNLPAILFLGFWIMVQLVNAFALPGAGGGVAFFAHIGGFAFGVLAGLIARIFQRRAAVRYRVY